MLFDKINNIIYDFYFLHNDKKYLIEFDGIQHFNYNKSFYKTEEQFVRRQEIDIFKTVNALKNGYILIRIAYSDINNIETILPEAITNPVSQLILSDREKYTWLLEAIK